MTQKKSTIYEQSRNGMQLIVASIFIFFIMFLTDSVLAQTSSVQQIPALKDGTRENYSQSDYENFLLREKLGEIPFQGGLVDQQAATDALVNNNTGSTGTSNFTQSETSIIAFGSNVLIGFNDSGSFTGGANKFTGYSYSTNGGTTFIDGGTLPTSAVGDAGDPVIARDETTGRIYFSTLGFSGSGTIQVFRSDDNGITYMAPVNGTPGGSNEDKQWIAVDNYAGTGNGNVYLMSRRFGGSQGIYMFRSTDNGATFGPSGGTLIVGGNQGAFVAVGTDHSVYAFWYAGTTLQVRKSTDLGVTFASAVTVASGLVGGTNGDLNLVGIRQGTATASYFRSNQFPHAAINPVSGHIYVTYDNDASGTDKADVFMTMSTDGGATWSASTRVNDDATTTDQWQPTIAVTPNGNNIGIFYYSRQEDAANNLFKYYGRIGSISGSTVMFDPSFAISDVASLPEFGRDGVVNSVYMGDYNHASATNSAFHVVWSDNRDDLPGGAPRKDPNVYYESIPIAQGQFLVWEGVLGGQDYSGAYINNFLTGLAYTVDYTSVFPSSLLGYDAVFLSFGNYGTSGTTSTVFDNTMASIVTTYLEAGGSVYLEGGDALEFDQSVNVPLHDLFGLGDGSDGGTNVIDGLQGQVGSLADGMFFTSSSQVNNNYIDIYLPSTGTAAFNESGYGDVAVQNSASYGQKTFCFSYALANLTDGTFPTTKNELMTRILNYLIGPPALPPNISVTPSSLTFDVLDGGTDLGVLTINNFGEQGLVWNILEQELPLDGIRLELEDGRELPIKVKPIYDWNKPVKGEDYAPLAASTGRPPSEVFVQTLYKNPEINNSLLFGTDAYATETQLGNYIQFDLGLPEALNSITPIADFIWAGDFGVDLTFAYAVNSATNEFISINKTTGVISVIGPCLPTQNPPSETFTGMAIDPTTGVVYLSSTDIVTSWLYTVNTSTGTPSLVAAITNSPGMIAIAINNSGQMYGHDIISDVMLSVDKSTGAGTILGPIGFDANFGQGMDFDPVTGTLYLSAFNNSTSQAELRTGNTTTGNTTLVGVLGSTTPGGLVQVGWVGLPGESSDCPWLSASPVSGAIPGGGNQGVDILVDATGLTIGTYNCNLIILSNDPVNSNVIVPVTLNVIPADPDINVIPTSLTFVVPENGSDTDIITIENTAPSGYPNLDWNIIEQSTLVLDSGIEIPVSLNMSTNSNQKGSIGKTQNINSLASNSLSKNIYSVGHPLEKNSSSGAGVDVRSVKDSKYGSIPANAGPECSGGLIYDDGTVENGYGWTPSLVTDGITLTSIDPPYYPYNIGQVCINWSTIEVDPNINYNIVVYDDDGAGGAPGTLLASIPVSATSIPSWPGFAFYDYDVTGLIPPVTSGTVYVGAQWNPTAEGNFYICSDESPTTPYHLGYGYNDSDGFWQTIDYWFFSYKAMFIRVEAAAEDIPWITENPLNGSIPAGSSQNVDVTIDATGLAGGTYDCILVIASNDPDENPVVVPVTLIVTSGTPPENFALVTNSLDYNFHIIDVASNIIVGPFLTGSLGSGYLLDPVITPDGQTALISDFTDQTIFFVDVSNPYNPSVSGFVNVGFSPEDIALTPDGAFALVTDGGASTLIAIIDVAAMSVVQTLDISPGQAQAVSIAPDGTVLVADYTNSQIHVLLLNLSTGLLTDLATAISVGSGPVNVAIGPDGQTALVANINSTAVDILQITAPGSVTLTGSVPNILNVQSIAFENSGSRAFAVQTGTTPDELAVLSVVAPGVVIDTGVRVSLLYDLPAGNGLFGIDVIDVSADGNWAYVGNPDISIINNDVAVVDLNSYTLSTSLTAGNYPTGIAVGGAGVTTFQLSVDVNNGWNMVSVPGINPDGMGVDTWWSGKDPAANVFKYGTGYQQVTTATPGEGYWMKHIGINEYNTGDEWPAGGIQIVSHEPITGISGWNLFGGYDLFVGTAGITTVPPGLQNSPVYKYGAGYEIATTLEPGYGYWMKLSGAGQIIIPEVLAKGTESVEYFPEDWGKILLTDGTGINYTLYAVTGEVDLDNYELPPAPPSGMFDIRFNSGRIAEDINNSIQTIDMSGVTYPLTVRVEGMDIRLQDEAGNQINTNLKSGEDLVIENATITKLMVTGVLIPAVYALEQNYPNPFNPSTVIEFSLPEDVGNVKLSIYNPLGEKVAELVNTALTAGKYQYQWNAQNAATGMYIYELSTDKFVSVKKMLLLK